jgi:hypothetical protein
VKLFGVLVFVISLAAIAGLVVAPMGCGGGSGSTALNYCAPGCSSSRIGDGICDCFSGCAIAPCNYDGGDCDWSYECEPGCILGDIGDGICNTNCYNANCGWDEGDCAAYSFCSAECPTAWLGNGWCDEDCNNYACDYDGGDCDIYPTPTQTYECSSGSSLAINDPDICCQNGYPYYWASDGLCHTVAPGTHSTPTPTQSYGCSAGSSPAVNDQTRCCPNGYQYYWSTDGNCHTTAWSAPTPAPACPTGSSQAVNNPSKCCPSGYPYYWDTDGKCHTTAPPAWRENIRSGDILLSPTGALTLGHVGICYGTDYIIEATSDGVTKTPIEDWDDKAGIYVLRVDCSDYTAAQAADLALTQVGKLYDYFLQQKSSALTSEYWYCSELVWAVYLNLGINLEYTPDDYGPVTPWEVYMSTQVIYHYGPPDIIPDSQ